jgi:hypothetical protein
VVKAVAFVGKFYSMAPTRPTCPHQLLEISWVVSAGTSRALSLRCMITERDFLNLVEVFAFLTPNGWQIPEWLSNWGTRLGFFDTTVLEIGLRSKRS